MSRLKTMVFSLVAAWALSAPVHGLTVTDGSAARPPAGDTADTAQIIAVDEDGLTMRIPTATEPGLQFLAEINRNSAGGSTAPDILGSAAFAYSPPYATVFGGAIVALGDQSGAIEAFAQNGFVGNIAWAGLAAAGHFAAAPPDPAGSRLDNRATGSGGFRIGDLNVTIPVPLSLLLLGIALAALGFMVSRRRIA